MLKSQLHYCANTNTATNTNTNATTNTNTNSIANENIDTILTKSLLGRCLGGCQFKLVVLSDTQMTMQLMLSNATPR